jgi:hypothetical protein
MTADDVEAIQRLIVTHERRVVDDSAGMTIWSPSIGARFASTSARVTGVVTGVWADSPLQAPPVEPVQTTQWQRRTNRPPAPGL